MGMTSFYMGSLRYGPTGKRRKNHAANPVKKKTYEFKPLDSKKSTLELLREEQSKQYKSLMEEAVANGTFCKMGSGKGDRKEPMKYTGTLIKGIATMHKSNAVPIMNKEQATEISRMAR